MNTLESTDSTRQAIEIVAALKAQIRTALIGQDEVIDHVLAALLAAGHVLIEGVPGLGKTLLVQALARTFNGRAARIQFTPDLMPPTSPGIRCTIKPLKPSSPAAARSSPTCCWPTRSIARRRKRRPRCSRLCRRVR